MATCRLYDLQTKDIISLADGRNLGSVYDVEIEEATGRVVSLIIPGRPRFFGLFGRRPDLIISWADIKKIGKDSILISPLTPLPEEAEKPWSFGGWR